jgi:hypothetical protein
MVNGTYYQYLVNQSQVEMGVPIAPVGSLKGEDKKLFSRTFN